MSEGSGGRNAEALLEIANHATSTYGSAAGKTRQTMLRHEDQDNAADSSSFLQSHVAKVRGLLQQNGFAVVAEVTLVAFLVFVVGYAIRKYARQLVSRAEKKEELRKNNEVSYGTMGKKKKSAEEADQQSGVAKSGTAKGVASKGALSDTTTHEASESEIAASQEGDSGFSSD
ncbi:unnamed protein product [Amoebophrya sp. A25]|nr:unnamed protein product [Amoebophrya sp. A25]|eukprot:GSA25T00016085001.1